MARIAGVNIPTNKPVAISLRYIYGIGPGNANDILAKANIDPAIRAKDLTEQQLVQVAATVDRLDARMAGLAVDAARALSVPIAELGQAAVDAPHRLGVDDDLRW